MCFSKLYSKKKYSINHPIPPPTSLERQLKIQAKQNALMKKHCLSTRLPTQRPKGEVRESGTATRKDAILYLLQLSCAWQREQKY